MEKNSRRLKYDLIHYSGTCYLARQKDRDKDLKVKEKKIYQISYPVNLLLKGLNPILDTIDSTVNYFKNGNHVRQ